MKLPNHDRAVADIDKLTNYNLNNEHPRGKHKAKVFAAALGLTQEDASELQSALLAAANSYEATATEAIRAGFPNVDTGRFRDRAERLDHTNSGGLPTIRDLLYPVERDEYYER
jgi:hypothetical protein